MRTRRGHAEARSIPSGAILAALLAALLPAPWASPASLAAQELSEIRLAEPGEVQELHLADGSTLVGRVVALGDPFRFELSSGGTVLVRTSQVRSLRTLEGEVRNGEIWAPDPSDNRLFFGPTGRMIGAGRGYLAVFEVLFPSVAVGLHDRATIGAGTLLVGDVGDSRPLWFLPKINVLDRADVDVSVGALAVTSLEGGWVGLLYGVGTFGSPRASVTAGLGYGWVEDDLAETPAVLLGGEARVARHVKLITENYLIPVGHGEFETLLSAGPRFFGDRLSADLGIALVPGAEPGFFPLVNFVYNW